MDTDFAAAYADRHEHPIEECEAVVCDPRTGAVLKRREKGCAAVAVFIRQHSAKIRRIHQTSLSLRRLSRRVISGKGLKQKSEYFA